MNEIELLTAYRQEMHKIQIKNGFTDEQMTSYRQGFMDAIGEYERRIAADVQPVKHGKWIDAYTWTMFHEFKSSGRGEHFWCSECKQGQKQKSNYCPNCGARLDSDAE